MGPEQFGYNPMNQQMPGFSNGMPSGMPFNNQPGAFAQQQPGQSPYINGGAGTNNGQIGGIPGGQMGAIPGSQIGSIPGGQMGAIPGSQMGSVPGGQMGAIPGSQMGSIPGGQMGGTPGNFAGRPLQKRDGQNPQVRRARGPIVPATPVPSPAAAISIKNLQPGVASGNALPGQDSKPVLAQGSSPIPLVSSTQPEMTRQQGNTQAVAKPTSRTAFKDSAKVGSQSQDAPVKPSDAKDKSTLGLQNVPSDRIPEKDQKSATDFQPKLDKRKPIPDSVLPETPDTTPSSSTPELSRAPKDHRGTTFAIIGGVLGATLAVVIVVILVLKFRRRKAAVRIKTVSTAPSMTPSYALYGQDFEEVSGYGGSYSQSEMDFTGSPPILSRISYNNARSWDSGNGLNPIYPRVNTLSPPNPSPLKSADQGYWKHLGIANSSLER